MNSSPLRRKRGSQQLPLMSIIEIYKLGKVRKLMMFRELKDKGIRNNTLVVETARKLKVEPEADNILSTLKYCELVDRSAESSERIWFRPRPIKTIFKYVTERMHICY